MALKNYISSLHKSTKRKYLKRMVDNKVKCMSISKKYGKDYWDGDRKYGYGGYKYIPGRWKPLAIKLIKNYKLKAGSRLLDVGCGKGYLLKELKLLIPELEIYGFDISTYAFKFIDKNISKNIFKFDARNKLPFKSKFFDLVISINTLHNLEINNLYKSIKEINRVGKKGYIAVESYRNNKELFNLQCWALTCNSFFSKNEWEWIFKENKYFKDHEFIYFS
tara:strand:- start:3434 stop:4096 length:663 start_codon:yes stop_codon:yes gene_type:complete